MSRGRKRRNVMIRGGFSYSVDEGRGTSCSRSLEEDECVLNGRNETADITLRPVFEVRLCSTS